MATKSEDFNKGFARGWDQGRAALNVELHTNIPQTQQKLYDLTQHDLDTIAMGIALVVLHAADIQTIEATMETQQKLGVAEKILGWLHLICEPPGRVSHKITLPETDPNPWLNPSDDQKSWDKQMEHQPNSGADNRLYMDGPEANDESTF